MCRHDRCRRGASRPALLAAIAALLLVGPLAGDGLAHVSVATQEDPDPAAQVTLELSFDHGCAGQPTTELAVQLPAGIGPATAEPIDEDGWSASLEDRTVTWSDGEPVADHVEHTFRLRLVLPDAPGETIHFPTIQRCGDEEYAWIQVPEEDESWSELEEPAPALTLTDRPSPGDEAAGETADADGADADDAIPTATPESDDDGSDAFLTDDDAGAGFPIIVLAVLVGLGAIATVTVLIARRGGGDDPSG